MTVTLELAPSQTRPAFADCRVPDPCALDRPPVNMDEPAGLSDWRAAISSVPAAKIDARQVRVVLSAVRAGRPLWRAASAAGVTEEFALDAVAGVGTRISQLGVAPGAGHRCVSLSFAERRKLGGPGVTVDRHGRPTIVMADGWQRSPDHPRNVSRSYGALLLSDPRHDTRPILRWLASLPRELPIGYAHHSHLRAVACGDFPTLAGLTEDPCVQRAYISAFDEIARHVSAACEALLSLCQPDVPVQWVRPYLRCCYWLTGDDTVRLAQAADAAVISGSRDGLDRALAGLRAHMRRRPRAYFPETLADLGAKSWRAAVAELGYFVAEMEDKHVSNPLNEYAAGTRV